MTKKLSKCKPRHIPINLELVPEINLCIDKPKVHIRHSRCKTKCHRRSKHKRKSKCKCKNHHKCKCEDEDSSHYSSSDFSDSRAIF